MLLRSEISDFFHCVWNPLQESGGILWLNPCRSNGEEVEIIPSVTNVTPLFSGALPWSQDDWWTCLGNLGKQIPVQEQGVPRNGTCWSSPALPILPGKQIHCNTLCSVCSAAGIHWAQNSAASGVKTEQGERSTFVIAQIDNNSTPASGSVFLEPRGRFRIQQQWIYCIFDLFTRCLILQQLILAFCTWDWFFNNLYSFHLN